MKYRFINEHLDIYRVATMCRVLRASRSGFYAWLHKPLSDRAIEDERLLVSICDSYTASSGVYGYPRVFADGFYPDFTDTTKKEGVQNFV